MSSYYTERFCNVSLEAFALNACAFLCLMTFEFMYVSPGDSLEHLSDCKKTIVRNASLHGGECKGYQKGVDFKYKDRWWLSPRYSDIYVNT